MHHTAEMIANLQAQLDMLKEVHREESKALKGVVVAHNKEGNKIEKIKGKRAVKKALATAHAKETLAVGKVFEAHKDETSLISDVAKTQRKVSEVALKKAPVNVMKSAEAKPAGVAPAATAAAPAKEKRGRGRPRKTPAPVPTVSAEAPAKAAEVPAAKPEPKPKMKLIAVVEPGMAPAELSGKAPETGPQETKAEAKPKKEKKPKKSVFMAAAEAALAAAAPAEEKKEKKPKKAKAPKLEVKEVEIVAPPMPAEKKEKKERKEPDHMAEARRMVDEGKVEKKGLAKKIKDMVKEKEETARREVFLAKDAETRDAEVARLKRMIKVLTAAKGLLSKKKD
jgi:hypothetical protein